MDYVKDIKTAISKSFVGIFEVISLDRKFDVEKIGSCMWFISTKTVSHLESYDLYFKLLSVVPEVNMIPRKDHLKTHGHILQFVIYLE